MPPSFLVDAMLGSLNRWLRICGFETEFSGDSSDEELLERGREKKLILLTRDQTLLREARRSGVEAFLVGGSSDEERLASVAREYGLVLNPVMARCTICCGRLNEVSRAEISGEVPQNSLEAYEEFWRCSGCGKVYWRGSHWERIVEKVSEASRIAGLVNPENSIIRLSSIGMLLHASSSSMVFFSMITTSIGGLSRVSLRNLNISLDPIFFFTKSSR